VIGKQLPQLLGFFSSRYTMTEVSHKKLPALHCRLHAPAFDLLSLFLKNFAQVPIRETLSNQWARACVSNSEIFCSEQGCTRVFAEAYCFQAAGANPVENAAQRKKGRLWMETG